MQQQEIPQFLMIVSSFDNRVVSDTLMQLWHEMLEPYSYQDCVQAVKDHHMNSTDYLTASHVIGRVKSVRRQRLDRTGEITLNPADEHTLDGRVRRNNARKLQGLRQAVADGYVTPGEYEHYKTGNLSLEHLRKKSAGELSA